MKTSGIFRAFAALVFFTGGQPSINAYSPIADLPSAVTATPGRVALVADFAGSKDLSHVSVYLINDSDKDITLNSQEGDVYLKLEAQTEAGDWVRAQTHWFDRCGNSYWHTTLKKGHFLLIRGYRPKSGRNAKVRYRLHNQEELDLVTAVADGLINESDVQKAYSDGFELRTGTFKFVVSVATGERKPQDPAHDMQSRAIRELTSGRFSAVWVLPVLDRIATEFPERQEELKSARDRLRTVVRGEQK